MQKIHFVVFLLVIGSSCSEGKKTHALINSGVKIKYAEGFKVSSSHDYTTVEVTSPYKGATGGYKYLLVQKGKEIPPHDASTTVITVPIDNIVCTSTTHIPLLDYLGETNSLIGFPTTDYISSIPMRQRIDSGKVKDLGIEKGMNIEQLVVLHPAMVMGYAMSADLGQLKKIQDLGIPVVINAEYLEKHPLGRAEWIKFMALFYNKQEQADSIFSVIEKEYNAIHEKVKDIQVRPAVLSGIVYGDIWYLPGGKNYAARMLGDAGLNYLWKEDSTSGFKELSFESVYETARNADVWIGVGSFKTLREIERSNPRYGGFKAFKDGFVYSYNARKGAKGGSEFLELGYLRPDYILKDLVKIGHPDLLPEWKLFFYERLK